VYFGYPAAMPKLPLTRRPTTYLGIEGGGTRTSVRLEDDSGTLLAEFTTGPAVMTLMSDRELQWHLRDIAERLPSPPHAIGIGLAGVRTPTDADRLRRVASRVWPKTPCIASNDLETALAAAPTARQPRARVLVLSGTGSCCFGRAVDGRTAKIGGRGHVIGDRASACDIGLRALRAVIADLDHQGRMGRLGGALLNALMFNEPEQLIPWSVQASKSEIGQLAVTVFAVAAKGDPLAKQLLADSAAMLAEDACACAAQIAAPGESVEFVFNGGVLLKNPSFLRDVSRRLRTCVPNAKMLPLAQPSVCGAVALAKQNHQVTPASAHNPARLPFATLQLPAPVADLAVLSQSPTEQRNPRSLKLDRLPLPRGVALMIAEDAQIAPALAKQQRAIAAVAQQVARAFASGGRLFYVGAGTSGRLGVLDASEIPPTFRAPREQVQGIIAGGRQALWSAVEGAEDDVQAGATAIDQRQIGPKDVVIGIAASGRTPFVWGALHEANRRHAFTSLLCFNPAIQRAARQLKDSFWQPNLIIAPDVGPEILTGSTRLKAGTATKLVLNMITTLAMVQSGKVISNLMVDLNPSNVKLRDRAIRMLVQLTGCSRDQAKSALVASGWIVKAAHQRLQNTANRKLAKP
jgi:N-acetylmuramic acid 6-phosphate etherase